MWSMTPEREKYLREDAEWGTLPATKRLEVFAALDEVRKERGMLIEEIEKLKKFAVRCPDHPDVLPLSSCRRCDHYLGA